MMKTNYTVVDNGVEDFNLPPHSHVTVLVHEQPQEHHTFQVVNKGNAPITAEVVHEDHSAVVHHIQPQENHEFTQDVHHKSMLKISNMSDHEAVFSAHGGSVYAQDLASAIMKIAAMPKEH